MFHVAAMNFDIPRVFASSFTYCLADCAVWPQLDLQRLLYWTEDLFEKLPIDELWWPAIGALGLGIIGYFVPRVLGVGYDTIGDILNANLALKRFDRGDAGESLRHWWFRSARALPAACSFPCSCPGRPWAAHLPWC